MLLLACASCAGGASSGGTLPSSPTSAVANAPGANATLAPTPTPNGALTATAGSGETPAQADAFVDAIGMNVHFVSGAAVYGNFPATQSLLLGLGVRHIRDGAAIGQPSVCSSEKQLAASGVRLDLVTSPNVALPNLRDWTACLGSAIDAIEGPNEYDVAGDPNWVSTLAAYVTNVSSAAKPVTVIAPSLTQEQDFLALGTMASLVDEGNMHNYFAGRNPGTPGWGGTDAYGTYGSLAYNLHLAAIVSGSQPVASTETGYSDDPADQYAIPAGVKVHYILRELLDDWNAGVVRTYLYELADEGGPPFSHYGLTDASGTPKPAYTALKNLIAHLADPGASFMPAPLDYTLMPASTVNHALFAKRNGHDILALWIEQAEWNPTTSSTIAISPQNVTLSFTHAPSALSATVFDDRGNVTTTTVSPPFTIAVTGNVTLVDITP